MALATATAGFFHGFGKAFSAGLLIAGWGLLALMRSRHDPATAPRRWPTVHGFHGYDWPWPRSGYALLLLACLLPVGALLLESLVPDASGDAYLYHLSAPLFYLLEGGFTRQDYAFYYHYPLLMEMLTIPALSYGLEQSAVFLNFWITLASALAIFHLGTRLHNRTAGWIATLIYLYAPLVIRWSPTTQPETGGTLLLLAALTAAWRWRRECQARWLLLAGFLTGALVGTKLLYAWFALGFTGLFLLVGWVDFTAKRGGTSSVRERQPSPRCADYHPLFAGLLFASVMGLTYAPWLLKNAIYTHNPLYPMALDLFPTIPWLKQLAIGYHHMHDLPPWHGLAAWATELLRNLMHLLHDQNPGFILGMITVPLALGLAFLNRRDRFFWSLLAVIGLVVWQYGGIMQARWFIPAYAVMGLASGRIMALLWAFPVAPRRLVMGGLAVLLVVQWQGGYRERLDGELNEGHHQPWTMLIPARRHAFIDTLPHVRTARLVDRTVPLDGRVLVFQKLPFHQVRWYHRRFIQNGQDWFEMMITAGQNDEQIAQTLRAAQVTYLCTSPPERDRRLAAFLATHARRLTFEGPFDVYAL